MANSNNTDHSNIQEVKISPNSGVSIIAMGIVLSLALNAYTLLKVAELTSLVTEFTKSIAPILGV